MITNVNNFKIFFIVFLNSSLYAALAKYEAFPNVTGNHIFSLPLF